MFAFLQYSSLSLFAAEPAPSFASLIQTLAAKTNSIPEREVALEQITHSDNRTNALSVFENIITDKSEPAYFRQHALASWRSSLADPDRHYPDLLITLALDPNEPYDFRRNALGLLAAAEPQIPAVHSRLLPLIQSSAEPEPLRLMALRLLATSRPAALANLPTLLLVAGRSNEPISIRLDILAQCRSFNEAARPTANTLLSWFADPSQPTPFRLAAADALLHIGPESLPNSLILPFFVSAGEIPELRLAAARLLLRFPLSKPLANPAEALRQLQSRTPLDVQLAAVHLFAPVAQHMLSNPAMATDDDLKRTAAILREFVAAASPAERFGAVQSDLNQIRQSLRLAESHLSSHRFARFQDALRSSRLLRHPAFITAAGIILFFCFLSGIWQLLLWSDPLQLLEIDQQLSCLSVQLPKWLGGTSFGLSHLLLLNGWQSHPKVLRAWLEKYPLPKSPAALCLPIPFHLSHAPSDPSDALQTLRALFQSPAFALLLTGRRGTGKTTLIQHALRLAEQNPAAPKLTVILSSEFQDHWLVRPAAIPEISSLILKAQRHCRCSPQWVQSLLRRGKCVLGIDGLSEWSPAARANLERALREFNAPCVVVTSRHDLPLPFEHVQHMVLRGLEGSSLAQYLERCLAGLPEEQRLSRPSIMEAAHALAQISLTSQVSPELVRLFAAYLAERSAIALHLPPPDGWQLVRFILEIRNQHAGCLLPTESLARLADTLAWALLHQRLSPTPIPAENLDAIRPLALPLERFEKYLAGDLQFLQAAPPDSFSFSNPLMAEYLVAHQLLTTHLSSEDAWRKFLARAETAQPASRPLLEALASLLVCAGAADFPDPPAFVWDALERSLTSSGSPDPAAPLHLRSRHLLQKFLSPENSNREALLSQLASDPNAHLVIIPALLQIVGHSRQELELRQSAMALAHRWKQLPASAAPILIERIRDQHEHLFIRLQALDLLPRVAQISPALIQDLTALAEASHELPFFRSRLSQRLALLRP